jgi:hypothetical protein
LNHGLEGVLGPAARLTFNPRQWANACVSSASKAGLRGKRMDTNKRVEELCREHNIDMKTLIEKSGLDEQRVLAILLGRWTPSPTERDRIAAVFGLKRDQVTWGHTTPIQHIYGSGPG